MLKVSVVIPSYNHENYLEEAIESVLQQSYRNIELVIVDDGSTDNSISIINKYCRHERVKILHKINAGAHQAINDGIQIAEGDFYSILNSDDVYEKDRIEKLVATCQEKELDLIFTDLVLIDEKSEPYSGIVSQIYSSLRKKCRDLPMEQIFLVGNIAFTTSNFFLSKKLYTSVGSFRKLRHTHDWDWLLRNEYHDSSYWLKEPLLRYRVHAGSTLRESDSMKYQLEDPFIFASYLKRRLKKSDNSDPPDPLNIFKNLIINHSFLPFFSLYLLYLMQNGHNENEILNKIAKGNISNEIDTQCRHNNISQHSCKSPLIVSDLLHALEENIHQKQNIIDEKQNFIDDITEENCNLRQTLENVNAEHQKILKSESYRVGLFFAKFLNFFRRKPF